MDVSALPGTTQLVQAIRAAATEGEAVERFAEAFEAIVRELEGPDDEIVAFTPQLFLWALKLTRGLFDISDIFVTELGPLYDGAAEISTDKEAAFALLEQIDPAAGLEQQDVSTIIGDHAELAPNTTIITEATQAEWARPDYANKALALFLGYEGLGVYERLRDKSGEDYVADTLVFRGARFCSEDADTEGPNFEAHRRRMALAAHLLHLITGQPKDALEELTAGLVGPMQWQRDAQGAWVFQQIMTARPIGL